mmetsp:Transcript_1841/g.3423  ORF Transcript_1841/g.3423 Transcript_1841/m.3423 type:complete len:690 (+) Transcript_1841:74-2143(+)
MFPPLCRGPQQTGAMELPGLASEPAYGLKRREHITKGLMHREVVSKRGLFTGDCLDGLGDVFFEIATFCDGPSLTALSITCHDLYSALNQRDEIWAALYNRLSFTHDLPVPVLSAGSSWKAVVLRSVKSLVRVVVRPISLGDVCFELILPRSTTLFGLKKLIRKRQLREHRVSLQNFELINVSSQLALGVQGYDILPPSDLSILFLSSDSLLRSMNSNESLRRMMFRHQRPAWRRTLALAPDGIELLQVFVTPQGMLESPTWLSPGSNEGNQNVMIESSTQRPSSANAYPNSIHAGIPHTELTAVYSLTRSQARPVDEDTSHIGRVDNQGIGCHALRSLRTGELNKLAYTIVDSGSTNLQRKEALEQMCDLLEESRRMLGYNAHKPFWEMSKLHPLIYVLVSKSGVSLPIRYNALTQLVRLYLFHLLSKDFMVAALARGVLQTGFPAAFIRLVTSLGPLIIRTQVKQIMEAEIDWVPLFFAVKFIARTILLLSRAMLPVMGLAFAHESLLVLIRTVFHEESVYDDWLVYMGILVAFRRKSPLPLPLSFESLTTPSRLEHFAMQTAGQLSILRRIWRFIVLIFIRTFTLDDLVPYTRMTRRAGLRVWGILAKRLPRIATYFDFAQRTLRHQVALQYVFSGILWGHIDAFCSDTTSMSMPVYAYSVPFVVSIMLVRLRMALSDSYYYMMYF